MIKKRLLSAAFILCFLSGYLTAQELPDQYKESFNESFPIREKQHLELDAYMDGLINKSEEERDLFFKPDYSSIKNYRSSVVPYREKLMQMIGYPPLGIKKGTKPRFELAGEDKLCKIYRVWLEVVDGVHAYGIYMVPRNITGKHPLLICVHGGSGFPEALCGFDVYENYHEMAREAVKRGYVSWSPSLLSLKAGHTDDPNWAEDRNRYSIDRKARLVGTSITAVEIYKITRGVEALIESRPEIDADKIGMTGVSRGGNYTLYTTAIYPPIKVGVASAYLVNQTDILSKHVMEKPDRFLDFNILNTFSNAQVVGLICPRPLMVQMGKNDGVFDLGKARSEAQKAERYYKKLGIEKHFEFFEHSGGHENHISTLFSFFERYLR
ncbi:hypothetical protein KAS50_06025 [bacterium]|nr:hypothetical protein [bacterium]